MTHTAADCTPACAAQCAGVASFPPSLRAMWDTGAVSFVGTCELLAEAWAWRMADEGALWHSAGASVDGHDCSAQSRRDAEVDAEALRAAVTTIDRRPRGWRVLLASIRALDIEAAFAARGNPNALQYMAVVTARDARRAISGLRPSPEARS